MTDTGTKLTQANRVTGLLAVYLQQMRQSACHFESPHHPVPLLWSALPCSGAAQIKVTLSSLSLPASVCHNFPSISLRDRQVKTDRYQHAYNSCRWMDRERDTHTVTHAHKSRTKRHKMGSITQPIFCVCVCVCGLHVCTCVHACMCSCTVNMNVFTVWLPRNARFIGEKVQLKKSQLLHTIALYVNATYFKHSFEKKMFQTKG